MAGRTSGNREGAPSPLLVREARGSDDRALLALFRVMMDEHRALDPRFRLRPDAEILFREDLRERIHDRSSFVRVAEVGGRVAGYLTGTERINPPLLASRRVGYIHELCVEPELRRRGVGRALAEAFLEWCRARGLREVQLRAAALNPQSQAFWRRLGWDAWTVEMWRELT